MGAQYTLIFGYKYNNLKQSNTYFYICIYIKLDEFVQFN